MLSKSQILICLYIGASDTEVTKAPLLQEVHAKPHEDQDEEASMKKHEYFGNSNFFFFLLYSIPL